MSIRTTVTLDDDIVARLKQESLSQGLPFGRVLNEAIRSGLLARHTRLTKGTYEIEAVDNGLYAGN